MSDPRFGHRWSLDKVPVLTLSLYFTFINFFANMSLLKVDGYKPNFPVSYEFLEGR